MTDSVDFERITIPPPRRPMQARMRYQVISLALVVLLSIITPLFITQSYLPGGWSALKAANFQASVFACLCASLLCLTVLKQLDQYPGIRAIVYVFPVTMLIFGFVALSIVVFRFDYSRYVVLLSFVATIFWLHAHYVSSRHTNSFSFAVIPGGKTDTLQDLPNVTWHVLEKPTAELSKYSGIVLDLRHDHRPDWEHFVANCVLASIPVYDIKHIAEVMTGKVEIEHLSENNFGSVLPSSTYMRIKRWLDFCLAIVLLPLFFFVIAITAIAIKMDSPGPAIFTQPRLGFRAKAFTIYKLRSMRQATGNEGSFTSASDSRITKIGKFIRKYRIDEFPQILNVLRGEMSWIGPRPESLELTKWYEPEIPFYIYRNAVRPGLSGWAQVNQGNVGEIEHERDKVQFDFYYIKHFSPWMDLLIVFRTIQIMLSGFGSR
ncbi:MAG: sugar transferase [Alphaproteobacteria bacterium]|nr:sugar transferase [Alphaproteobacteria bacterium]